MNNSGTWIDWQYLLDAAALLKKVNFSSFFHHPPLCTQAEWILLTFLSLHKECPAVVYS